MVHTHSGEGDAASGAHDVLVVIEELASLSVTGHVHPHAVRVDVCGGRLGVDQIVQESGR